MRYLLAALLLSAASTVAQPAAERVPVVVELFTSEGCSSCPPADTVLSTLATQQPIAGVEIVPLGMHVTYWDQLGWKDQASLGEATARQQDYGRVFGADRIYTPQAVVDGRDEAVGSDANGVKRAIAHAAGQPHARVSLSVQVQGDAVAARAVVSDVPADVKEKLRTLFALTEDGVSTVVKRGENGGRTLHHDAVVRRLSASGDLGRVSPGWRRDRLHVVAIAQGATSLRIIGAAIAAVQ